MTTEPRYTTLELAEALRCSPRFVRLLIDAGTVHAKKLGADYRIPASEAARVLGMDTIPTPPKKLNGNNGNNRNKGK